MDLRFSTDLGLMSLDFVHAYLSGSYWAQGIPRSLLEKAMHGSLNFAAFDGPASPERQVAYARVITDRATFAYLCDVFVDPARQGRGIGKALIKEVLAHPELQGLRRFSLMTRDAHGLYRSFGFGPAPDPSRYMEIVRPGIYLENAKMPAQANKNKAASASTQT